MKNIFRRFVVTLAFFAFTAGFLFAPESKSASPTDIVGQLTDFWAFQRYSADDHKTVFVDPMLAYTLLAKAQPDECFNGVGQPYPPMNPDGTCSAGTPKTNQAYVWGLTKAGDDLWFGTIANTLCLVESGYLGLTSPQANDYFTCEFNQAKSGTQDFRPPRIFRYNTASFSLEEMTGLLTPAAKALLSGTIGLRSAGSLNGVAFLAGLSFAGGVNMFAFDTDTGAFLGAKAFPQYSDIRIWLEVNGALYTSVGLSNIPNPSAPGGAVLRWVGKKSTNPSELFAFDVVGNLDAPGAYLALHNRRIYISTWPVFSQTGGSRLIGVYQGPVVPDSGLTTADANRWMKVWRIDDYEIDPIVQASTAGGALASFGGELYWGTMQVPFTATAAALELNGTVLNLDTNGNGKLDASEMLATALGTHRSIAIFRGFRADRGHEDGGETVRLVYGERYLPTYDPVAKSYTIGFDAKHENNLHQTPLQGASGMGNFFNTYTWAMGTFGDHLFIGTFDWSQVLRVTLQELAGINPSLDPVELQHLIDKFGASIPTEGADLFRVDDRSGHASAESIDGIDNFTNYGIRTMLSTEDAMYLGTANPMNLHPRGGWELLKETWATGGKGKW